MKKMLLLTFGLTLLLCVLSMPLKAQVVNGGNAPATGYVCSDDNEDGVVKLDANRSRYDYVQGQVLVKFKDENRVQVNASRGQFRSTSVNRLTQVLQKYGAEEMEQLLPRENPNRKMRRAKAYSGDVIQERDLSQLYRIRLSDNHALETMALVDELKQLDEVEFAEPNYILHTLGTDHIADNYSGNPMASQQWYLDAYGVKELWDKPIINKERPVIAIIDTGVDLTHPDLKDNLWTNQAEAEGEAGYDNDGNGFKGDVHGWDFINNTPNIRDNNMHGTHVAGIAAASNNNIGIVGANPRALIMPVSVMQSDGTGDIATIIKGIDYAVANGATVLNLSIGTYANSSAMRQALERAYQSAVIVAAAGNDFRRNHREEVCTHKEKCGYGIMFPAGYSFVLGVQATTQDGSLAAFSNHDSNGPTYSSESTLQDPDGFNYELQAPGTNMLSAIPGGKYKVLQGTSMAAPLVAGAISALKMVKQYDNQEVLWGDLLHSDNIAGAYNLTKRPAELDLMKVQLQNRKDLADETEEDYSGDHEVDAGEIVSVYPVIRSTFGEASNIKLKLEMGDEFEDASTVEFITPQADFGMHLDAYGRGVSWNPLVMKVANNVADARHIKLKVVATCDESPQSFELPFTIVVTNLVKINGLISKDMTLTADHTYLVNENLGIMEGATLTIEPGTRIEVMEGMGISSFGRLVAKGTPEKPIVFTRHLGEKPWLGIQTHESTIGNPRDTLSFCKLNGFHSYGNIRYSPYYKDCVITSDADCGVAGIFEIDGIRSTISIEQGYRCYVYRQNLCYSNIVNCSFENSGDILPKYSQLKYNNYFNCIDIETDKDKGKYYGKEYWIANSSSEPDVDKSDNPSYLGTACERIVRPFVYEIGNALNTYGQIDLSNMRTTPIPEAHGIVWKVVVNGKDAQDEYEDLAPLGVGRHKFEVYFNRPMNKAVAPNISFGVRDPWTQQGVREDGSWNDEGTIYTAYKTIDGKTKSDGINRIYVYGAEDDEYFEIPYEKTRFNIQVQAAGSMATGFAAEAGLGRVSLTWDNSHNDFDDAMGFNIYRYTYVEKDSLDQWGNPTGVLVTVPDTIRINTDIVDIETTEYTDYDVTPGETYYYMYKVLSTDLQEYDVSNVVAATPLTSTLGDANGSGAVDVADVITTVNYAAGMEPKPFIFEAADMNTDANIDILDVIGIIQKILNPNAARAMAMNEATAVYTIEDGVLYVESPVSLAGIQVQLNLDGKSDISATSDLDGFEHASAWLSDNDYLFLAYNLNGKTLAPGKHALLHIGNAQIVSIRLSDVQGHNVIVEGSETTFIDRMGKDVMTVKGIYDLQGRKLAGVNSQLSTLKKGVYIINGEKVVK